MYFHLLTTEMQPFSIAHMHAHVVHVCELIYICVCVCVCDFFYVILCYRKGRM